MKNKKIAISIVLVVIVLLIVMLYLTKKEQDVPGLVVENQDNVFDDIEYVVPPDLWIEYLYGEDLPEFEKAKAMHIFKEGNNDYVKNNISLIGKSLPNNMMVANNFDEVINISNLKSNKVIILTNLDDSRIMNNIEDYLYLKQESEGIEAYGVYIVNTNEEEKKEFFEKVKDGFILTDRNREVNKFLKDIDKNIILLVNEDNIIEVALDYAQITNLSMFAMYAFNGDISIKDYLDIFDDLANNPQEKTQIFLNEEETTKTYESIIELNLENNFSFFEISGIDGFIPDTIELLNNNFMRVVYKNDSNMDRVVMTEQKYGFHTFSGEEKYTYVSQHSKDLTFYDVYGNSKDEIYAFKLIKNNICVFIESTTPMTITEIENIIDNTF
jgi:hypothetical protein